MARRVVLSVPAFGDEGDVIYADTAPPPAAVDAPVPPGARGRLPDTGPSPPRPSLWSVLKVWKSRER